MPDTSVRVLTFNVLTSTDADGPRRQEVIRRGLSELRPDIVAHRSKLGQQTEARYRLYDASGRLIADGWRRAGPTYEVRDPAAEAWRKSLARCISLRQSLFKKDIRTTRMDVRALGLKSEGQPADRVDIVPANS